MSYVTPLALFEQLGISELHQSCVQTRQVSQDLLRMLILGQSTASFPPDSVALGQVAVLSLQRACDSAVDLVRSYVSSRWGRAAALALTPSGLVKQVAFDCARYYMHDLLHDLERSSIYQRFIDARRLLEEFSKGRGDLGLDAPATTGSDNSTSAMTYAPAEVFSPSFVASMP